MGESKEMRVSLPKELNKLLRQYALEYDKGSREKATIFILGNFLYELYKTKKK